MKYGENNRKNAKSTSVGTQNALRFQTPRSAGIKPDTLLGGSALVKTESTLCGYFPLTACRTIASAVRRSSMAICPGAELLLPTAKVAAEP